MNPHDKFKVGDRIQYKPTELQPQTLTGTVVEVWTRVDEDLTTKTVIFWNLDNGQKLWSTPSELSLL